MAVVNSVVNATPISLQETITQGVATRIKEVVEKYFDANNEYKWKKASDILANFTSSASDYNLVDGDCNFN
jgi:hypothetical protein